jgi:anti-sigma factor NepR-like protein
MTNIGSAEPLSEVGRNPAVDDKPLTQHAKSPRSTNQPQLRIVHSVDCLHAPSPVKMPLPPSPVKMPLRDRPLQAFEKPPAMLDRAVQAQIGRLLRDVFTDVADEPVPHRFITLLAELESKSKEKSR